jgi:hypothetical protein
MARRRAAVVMVSSDNALIEGARHCGLEAVNPEEEAVVAG